MSFNEITIVGVHQAYERGEILSGLWVEGFSKNGYELRELNYGIRDLLGGGASRVGSMRVGVVSVIIWPILSAVMCIHLIRTSSEKECFMFQYRFDTESNSRGMNRLGSENLNDHRAE